MEDVGDRRESCEGASLRQLPSEEATGAAEIEVGLRMELVAVEHDELRVDATCSQRLDVRPRDACGVDGTVRDAHAATLPRELERIGDHLVVRGDATVGDELVAFGAERRADRSEGALLLVGFGGGKRHRDRLEQSA